MIDLDMEHNDPPFTFRAVQNFVAAVEAQSVTRAAYRLGTSPSSVSQQLSALEAALGTRLIERSARQFRLTRAGALFLDPAKALLDENPDPTEEEVRYWLAGNLCRCTGYDKIVRAVLDAAAELRREAA